MKKKPTGEGKFLDSILETREHLSFISGLPIEGSRANCAHVLPKGAYPELKYDPENIVLLTWKEHQLFDQATEQEQNNYRVRMLASGHEVNWQKLYELKERLFHEKSK